MAGSAIEALLLSAIQRPSVKAKLANLTDRPKGGPEHWDLHDYIKIAERLSLIKANTATQARLTQGFRNLIHPGRAQRTAEKCDRGTALTALAGVELVVRDLTL